MKAHGFALSRMLAFSKSTYVSRHPNNQAIFNANVVTTIGKIWWGDLDLTDDSKKLQQVANTLDCNIYIYIFFVRWITGLVLKTDHLMK